MQSTPTSAAQLSFERGVAAMRADDPAAAERICRRALDHHPRDANLHSLLGAALIKQGRIALAEQSLRRAAELMPAAAGMHEGLAQALALQGKLEPALASYETARRLEPGRASVLHNMGELYTRQGRHDLAANVYRELVVRYPNDVEALERLSGAAFRLRLYPEAEAILLRALALQPDNHHGWMDLGLVQHQQNRLERAEQSFREAARLDPSRADPHAALGTVLTSAGRHAEAQREFGEALVLDPAHAEALAGLGHLLKTLGERDRAIEAYRACIRHHPDDGEAYWSLAGLKTFRFDDAEIATMREQLAANRLQPVQRTSMSFALATALDSQGKTDEAFDLFVQANTAMRSRLAYDADATRIAHDRLIEVFGADFLASRGDCGVADDGPIFIVGLPRSGSTLLEQVLASHSAVQGTYELPELHRIARLAGGGARGGADYPLNIPPLRPEELRALGADYLASTLGVRNGAPRFTDKMPSNFRHIGLISIVLPGARILNAQRHPLDTCLSCYKQLFAHGQHWSYDLRELGLYYLEYERLMAHWRAVLPGRVLDVSYESVVNDFEATVRRVLEHCGLEWEESCLRFHENRRPVRTASSEQVRQPLYSSGMGRWRAYEDHLAPLIEVLEPLLLMLPPEQQPRSLQQRSAG
jgi:tetratricopeptide (TPR) repeat protein